MKKLAAVVALTFLALEGAGSYALAAHRGSIRGSTRIRREIEIRDNDAVRLQREAIAAREEAVREQGRKVRRDEIEQELEKRQAEYLESQAAIREASFAARNSPRGLYYRKPGTRSSRLPAAAQEVFVDKRQYFYYQGVYYRKDPSDYVVVTAPVDAFTADLPDGSTATRVDGRTYYYYFGSFYRKDGDGYRVTAPMKGSIVTYLPDGYRTEKSDGGTVYNFGGIRYRPFYREGVLVYAVQGI